MRIRRGHWCLPLPHANGSSLRGVLDDARDDANQALLNLVALADNLIDGTSQITQEHSDTSAERKKFPEPEENRHSLNRFQPTTISTTAPHFAMLGAKSIFSMREPYGTTRTTLCNPSTTEIQHKSDVLEQSLCHIRSSAGMTDISVRDAVFQMIEQGLPGLRGVGERLVEEVEQSFMNSSKFVESKERRTYCLQDLPGGSEKKFLTKGDSELHHAKTVSSSDMLVAAKQLQDLQKSCSNSLGFGVIESTETSSVRDSKRKVVQNNPIVRQSKVATFHKDISVRTHNSISSTSRSRNLRRMDQIVTLCTRDDGKGWRCARPAQVGFAMCAYHRDLINQGKERRMRARLKAEPNPQFRYVANARVMKNATMTETSWSPFSDDELSYDEHRQFVKAKTITSLLNSDVRPRH